MRRARLAALLVPGAAMLAAAAVAAALVEAEPVLHEYVAPPVEGPGRRIVAPGLASLAATELPGGTAAPASSNPAAIRGTGGQLLPEPGADTTPGHDEPTYGRGGFGADRETRVALDPVTTADGTLFYTETFNPSVVPFKRMSALDAVASDFALRRADDARVDLSVGGAEAGDRDLFWGSIVVELAPRREVPIPSVAPDMRILSYEARPPTQVVFSRDGADNYYVRAAGGDATGVHRLVFLVDAPASYFGARVPPGLRVADAAAGPLRPVPPEVRPIAEDMARRMGVSRSQPLDVAVNRLVEYFRTFEPGDPPASTGNLYRDLTLARRGVCRHRAFAFVVTANTLGVPARFVTNEAHAFAEIWIPRLGWLRVDLGGASDELQVSNTSDKARHHARAADGFPRPPQYARASTRMVGSFDDRTPGTGARPGPGAASDGWEALARAQRARESGTPPSEETPPPGSSAPGHASDFPSEEPGPPKTPVDLSVATPAATAFRGEAIQVTGTARAGDHGVGGLEIQLYLVPPSTVGSARLLGRTVTDARGDFTATIALPPDLPLGPHEVYAATPGDQHHASGLSR